MLTGLDSGLVELDFIQETALEGFIHILLQIGGGDEDAIEGFHLLQNDVLDTVLHLVHTPLCHLLTTIDDGIGFVEQQDGCKLAVLHLLAIVVEQGLDVLLRVTYPLALYLRDVHLHDVTTRLTSQLKNGLCLTRARRAIEQAGKSATEALVLQTLANLLIVVFVEQTCQFVNLTTGSLVIEQLMGSDVAMTHHATLRTVLVIQLDI